MSTNRIRTWFAGFKNGEQVTKWYRSRDKAWKCARAAKANQVRGQQFMEKLGAET